MLLGGLTLFGWDWRHGYKKFSHATVLVVSVTRAIKPRLLILRGVWPGKEATLKREWLSLHELKL